MAPVKVELIFAFIQLVVKLTFPPLAVAGGDNCSAFNNALIVADPYFSYLAVSVTELDLAFVILLLSPVDIFYFASILFG